MNRTILHAIASLEGGGAERQLVMLANEQARRGWHVHLAVRRGGVHEAQLAPSIATHVLGDFAGGSPELGLRITRVLRTVRPALVQTWLPQMDVIAGVASLAHRIPWVLSERASDLAYPASFAMRLRKKIGRFASAIVANSTAGTALWEAGRGSVSEIRNALDLAAIEATPPGGEEPPYFLFAGRLSAEKRPDLLLAAMRHVPGARLRMLGEGALRPTLQRAIERHALDVTVERFRADWWSLLKTASAIVCPSQYEGEPNVVLEAMAAGCPVVASDIAAHREILDQSCALLVPFDDPLALAGALHAVRADPLAARARARIASMRVQDRSIDKAASLYDGVYARAIGSGR